MEKIRIGIELPNTAMNTAASAIPGKDMMMSSTRIRVSETQRELTAAMEPRTAAHASANSVAQMPMVREIRAP